VDPVKAAQIILSGSYERRRGYLFAAITVMNQLAVTATLGIWVAILRLEHSTPVQLAMEVGWAGSLTSILIGCWRYYAHFLDHAIVRQYPAMYLSERAILPPEVCTLRPPEGVSPITEKDIELGVAFEDVYEKAFGSRGHVALDFIAGGIVNLCAVASVLLGRASHTVTVAIGAKPHVIGYLLIGNLLGLVLVVAGHFRWRNAKHKWPVPTKPAST
jgi:hypothetical protein